MPFKNIMLNMFIFLFRLHLTLEPPINANSTDNFLFIPPDSSFTLSFRLSVSWMSFRNNSTSRLIASTG